MFASGWVIWHQSISRHGIDLIPWSCLRWKHWSNATLVAGVKSYKHKSNAVSDNGWMYFSTRSSADTAFITPHAHSTDKNHRLYVSEYADYIQHTIQFCQTDISKRDSFTDALVGIKSISFSKFLNGNRCMQRGRLRVAQGSPVNTCTRLHTWILF